MIDPKSRKVSGQSRSGVGAAFVQNCPQDDGTGYLFYPLNFSPPPGQYIRIKFFGASPQAERLVVWAGDDSPTNPVGKVQAHGSWQLFEITHSPGGQLWFTFQHCFNGMWIDYRLTSFEEADPTDAAYAGLLHSLDPYDPGTPTSVANIAWGPNVRPVPPTSTYSVTFENIEVLVTRSRHEDTNWATLAAVSPAGGKLGPVSKFLGDQGNGVHGVGLTTLYGLSLIAATRTCLRSLTPFRLQQDRYSTRYSARIALSARSEAKSSLLG
jgi:hypothetical protein